MERKQILENFIQEVINKKVIPFFKEYLPEIYDENVSVIVDFKDGIADGKIGADKNTPLIHYWVDEEIGDLDNIGGELTTFQAITGVQLKNGIQLPREEAYALHLIHEFAHKFHWNVMKNNNSYQGLNAINREYFFPAIESCKSIGKKMNISNPQEIVSYIKNLSEAEIPECIREEYDFLNKSVKGIKLLDFAMDKYIIDNNLGIDIDETFAKSVERIYIENTDLDPAVKDALLKYGQDWFEKHPIVETEDIESKTSTTYKDEVFFRLYNQVGKDRFVEYLKTVNYFEFAKLRVRDIETQEYSEEYKRFLQNPVEYLDSIREEVGTKSPIEGIFEVLSSEQATELGIDTRKYLSERTPTEKNISMEDMAKNALATGGRSTTVSEADGQYREDEYTKENEGVLIDD